MSVWLYGLRLAIKKLEELCVKVSVLFSPGGDFQICVFEQTRAYMLN